MTHVVVRPDFYADAQSAADWYDGERSGLGSEFLDELNRSVVRLIAAPESFALVDRRTRICRLQRFPYGIYFRAQAAEIVITAILHLHRDDTAWKSRK